MGLGRGSRIAALIFGLQSIPLAGCAVTSSTPVETPDAAPAAVAWATWSAESFAQADAGHRIILVNVVAGWCHWCHVMDEKTYGDARVAALLGEQFVTIRVDSDARPDIAERYSAWGWPATAILTPDGKAVMELRGYQDPEKFLALLEDLAARHDSGTLDGRVEPPPPEPRDEAGQAIYEDLVARLDGYYDVESEGWGHGSQKYPLAEPVEHAFARSVSADQSVWNDRALETAGAMAELIDPVWGGVYQYSLGGVWTKPHYEKIAAIQAGAIRTFAQAYRRTGDTVWLERADAVVGYLDAFLRQEGGGFGSSQDADLRTGQPGGHEAVEGVEYYALDDPSRRALGIPRIDDSVYADLNGRLIAALAERYRVEPEEGGAALEMALTAARVIERDLTEASGVIVHEAAQAADGRANSSVYYLRDQALVGWGYLQLFRVTGDAHWFERAKGLADVLLSEFQDGRVGGFWANTVDPAAVGSLANRRKPLEDNAWAARLLLGVHDHLDHGSGEPTPYSEAAAKAIRVTASEDRVKPEGRFIGPLVLAAEDWVGAKAWVTISGRADDPKTLALHRAVLPYDDARLIVEVAEPGVHYPDRGNAEVYVCTDSACSQPIKNPADVGAGLEKFVGSNLP